MTGLPGSEKVKIHECDGRKDGRTRPSSSTARIASRGKSRTCRKLLHRNATIQQHFEILTIRSYRSIRIPVHTVIA